MARGVEQRVIFDDDRDRQHFIQRLEEGVEEYGVRLYLFCLMSNHFHLLVETPRGNLSSFMHKVQTAHTVYYNLRHQRRGHLLQGRFTAKLVEGDEYLGKLSRYIHLNPVYVGRNQAKPLTERIQILRDYRWSSYPGYAGLAPSRAFVVEAPLLEQMSGKKEIDRRKSYRSFVETGVAKCDEEFMTILKNSVWGIGGEEFQARIRDTHTDMVLNVRRREDVALRKIRLNVSPDEILQIVGSVLGVAPEMLSQRVYGSRARAVAAQMLMKYSGMNQRDVAARLNVGTGAAVSQQLTALRADMESNADLARYVAKIEKRLDTSPGLPHQKHS